VTVAACARLLLIALGHRPPVPWFVGDTVDLHQPIGGVRIPLPRNATRKVVVVMRERGGSTLPSVFRSESAALG